MLTITGFTFFVNSTSRQITSDASALPPGLLTLNTTALIVLSVLASRIVDAKSSEPMFSSSPFPEFICPFA